MESSTTRATLGIAKTRGDTRALIPVRTLAGGEPRTNSKAGSYVTTVTRWPARLEFAVVRVLFDVHVFELAGLEDLAALFAFDEFGVFVSTHDLDAEMFAR